MLSLENLVKISKKRKRVGRGLSRGGKSGRGSKGQKSRSGGKSEIRASFNGGQMSLCRRLPRRGFSNARNKTLFEIVALEDVAKYFAADNVVSRETLLDKGLIEGKQNHLIKLLGPNVAIEKMSFEIDAASKSAVQAIEAAGGSIRFTK